MFMAGLGKCISSCHAHPAPLPIYYSFRCNCPFLSACLQGGGGRKPKTGQLRKTLASHFCNSRNFATYGSESSY